MTIAEFAWRRHVDFGARTVLALPHLKIAARTNGRPLVDTDWQVLTRL